MLYITEVLKVSSNKIQITAAQRKKRLERYETKKIKQEKFMKFEPKNNQNNKQLIKILGFFFHQN